MNIEYLSVLSEVWEMSEVALLLKNDGISLHYCVSKGRLCKRGY